MNKIIVSGFGGQGVLSLGLFISYSAMNMGQNTSWLPSYGPEMRGGTANCSVVCSLEQVASPVIAHPNYLVVMNEPSLAKFESKMEKGGIMLVNSSIVKLKATRDDIMTYYIPVDDLASQINPRGGNIIMLGILIGLFQNISVASAEEAIRQVFKEKPKVIDINIACLHYGLKYINDLRK